MVNQHLFAEPCYHPTSPLQQAPFSIAKLLPNIFGWEGESLKISFSNRYSTVFLALSKCSTLGFNEKLCEESETTIQQLSFIKKMKTYFKSNQKLFVYPWSSGREQTSFWNVLQTMCVLCSWWFLFWTSAIHYCKCRDVKLPQNNVIKIIRDLSTSPILNKVNISRWILTMMEWKL